MKVSRRIVAIMLIVIVIALNTGTYGQEVPADVWSAGREGLSDFFWIVGMDPKLVLKYPDGSMVSNIRESYLGTPYMPLLISDEEILQCTSPADILKTAREDGYEFPILNSGSAIAYIAVRFMYVVEDGIERWYWGNMRLHSEYDRRYYELLEAYPAAEGYSIFIVSWEYPSHRFFMIKPPIGAVQVYPGSKFIADILDESYPQINSHMPADANELLARLKNISVEHFATKQRLQKETNEWQRRDKEAGKEE